MVSTVEDFFLLKVEWYWRSKWGVGANYSFNKNEISDQFL